MTEIVDVLDEILKMDFNMSVGKPTEVNGCILPSGEFMKLSRNLYTNEVSKGFFTKDETYRIYQKIEDYIIKLRTTTSYFSNYWVAFIFKTGIPKPHYSFWNICHQTVNLQIALFQKHQLELTFFGSLDLPVPAIIVVIPVRPQPSSDYEIKKIIKSIGVVDTSDSSLSESDSSQSDSSKSSSISDDSIKRLLSKESLDDYTTDYSEKEHEQ
ncbi:hypothetical protein FQA39_LY08241 [Lamprigera yunnana]|nr:hypothetical protein FQA39_LY08241 [Lamprigera yunnana]